MPQHKPGLPFGNVRLQCLLCVTHQIPVDQFYIHIHIVSSLPKMESFFDDIVFHAAAQKKATATLTPALSRAAVFVVCWTKVLTIDKNHKLTMQGSIVVQKFESGRGHLLSYGTYEQQLRSARLVRNVLMYPCRTLRI